MVRKHRKCCNIYRIPLSLFSNDKSIVKIFIIPSVTCCHANLFAFLCLITSTIDYLQICAYVPPSISIYASLHALRSYKNIKIYGLRVVQEVSHLPLKDWLYREMIINECNNILWICFCLLPPCTILNGFTYDLSIKQGTQLIFFHNIICQ